jgi:hypothetical protein
MLNLIIKHQVVLRNYGIGRTAQRTNRIIERGISLSAAILAVVSASILDLVLVENHKLSMMSIIRRVPNGLVFS